MLVGLVKVVRAALLSMLLVTLCIVPLLRFTVFMLVRVEVCWLVVLVALVVLVVPTLPGVSPLLDVVALPRALVDAVILPSLFCKVPASIRVTFATPPLNTAVVCEGNCCSFSPAPRTFTMLSLPAAMTLISQDLFCLEAVTITIVPVFVPLLPFSAFALEPVPKGVSGAAVVPEFVVVGCKNTAMRFVSTSRLPFGFVVLF